jgi:glycosyltransferase involved in cell wall biosynthesis
MSDKNTVLVSVIIPMRNEEKFVGKCLESFLQQIKYREDIEILCVDGMSTDKTREIIERFSKVNHNIHLVENPGKTMPTGFNIAIGKSKGDFIVMAGCQAEYAPDYINKCLEVLKRTGADQAGGYFITVPSKDTPVGRAIAAVTSSRFGVGSGQRVPGPERETNISGFGCFRRDVFDRFGLFDERLVRNQDVELFYRIRKNGGKIVVSPDIGIKYYNRATFSGLMNQAFLNGLWNPYTVWLTRGGVYLKHFIPLIFLLSIVTLGLGGFLWQPLWLALCCELLVYVVAAWTTAIRLASRAGTSSILIFLAFVQLHFAYGAGTLWGVLTAPFKFGFQRNRRIDKTLR